MAETKINFVLDINPSILTSYHILNTDLCKEYNNELFQRFGNFFSKEQKEIYTSFLRSKGITKDKFYAYKSETRKGFEDAETYSTNLPLELQESFKNFSTEFGRYFNDLDQRLSEKLDNYEARAEGLISKVYYTAFELTGTKIEKPEKFEVIIIEGLSPGPSTGRSINGEVRIISHLLNVKTFDDFLLLLIHETVAHKAVDPYRKLLNVEYKNEEGFVKVFSEKIATIVAGKEVRYGEDSLSERSYYMFKETIDGINRDNFVDWYNNCLKSLQ